MAVQPRRRTRRLTRPVAVRITLTADSLEVKGYRVEVHRSGADRIAWICKGCDARIVFSRARGGSPFAKSTFEAPEGRVVLSGRLLALDRLPRRMRGQKKSFFYTIYLTPSRGLQQKLKKQLPIRRIVIDPQVDVIDP